MKEHILVDAIDKLDKDVVAEHMDKKMQLSFSKGKKRFSQGGTGMDQNSRNNKWLYAFLIAAVLLFLRQMKKQ